MGAAVGRALSLLTGTTGLSGPATALLVNQVLFGQLSSRLKCSRRASIWSPALAPVNEPIYPITEPITEGGPRETGCGCDGTVPRPCAKSTNGRVYGPLRRREKSVCTSLLSRGRSDDPAGVGKAVWVIKSPVSSVLGGLKGMGHDE